MDSAIQRLNNRGLKVYLLVVVLIAQFLPDVLMLLYCVGLATIKDFLKEHVVPDIRNQIVRTMVMPNIPVTAGKILYLRKIYYNGDVYRGRLRESVLSTKKCAGVNPPSFLATKRDGRCNSSTGFSENVAVMKTGY